MPVLTRIERDTQYSLQDPDELFVSVRDAAYQIIKAKGATYYGIAMGLVRITKAILHNENAVLTVSAHLSGEYGEEDVYIGVPAVINRRGIREVVELILNDEMKNRVSLRKVQPY